MRVFVEGRYSTRSYDAQDGTRKYVTEVVANFVAIPLGTNSSSSYAPQQSQGNSFGGNGFGGNHNFGGNGGNNGGFGGNGFNNNAPPDRTASREAILVNLVLQEKTKIFRSDMH